MTGALPTVAEIARVLEVWAPPASAQSYDNVGLQVGDAGATVDSAVIALDLTPAGDAFIRQILPRHFQLMAALMQPLSIEERKTLVGLLNKVLRHAPNCGKPVAANE